MDKEIQLLVPSKVSNMKEIKNGAVDTLNMFRGIANVSPEVEGVTHSGGEEVYGEFATYKKDLYRVGSIYNHFGTAVVLDATAELNKFYTLTSESNSNIAIVAAPKVRQYRNLTINKAQGHRQSANAIHAGDPKVAKENAGWYTDVIEEILEEDDKLLVISFKKFIDDHLKSLLEHEPRVVFTNWGKHVGRNSWSDCNKVLLIGWLRLPDVEVVSKMFNISSLGTSDTRIGNFVTPENIEELKQSEIADDLVQGAMRCCARIINNNQSDCKKASFYLFQDTLPGSDQVMTLFESQFPQAKIVNWKPKAPSPFSSLSIPDQRKEQALQDLAAELATSNSYSRSDFCKNYKIAPGTLSRWLKSGHFPKGMKDLNIKLEKPSGKPEKFVLR